MPGKIEDRSHRLPVIGMLLVVIFWLLDATLDLYLFTEGEHFIESLFFPEPVELWMRIIISVLIISFSFYASRVLRKQFDTSQQLSAVNRRLNEEIDRRVKTEEVLEYQASHDGLTGLLNRRKFNEVLQYEIEREKRYKGGLTFIFCDIDHFKRVNDGHGHEVGDEVLKLFAKKLKASVRDTDIISRWGGEEFVLLLLNTVPEKTERMADSIREKMACSEIEAIGKITVSMGVTHFIEGDTKQSLFSRADKALHLAKGNGRNRVEIVIS